MQNATNDPNFVYTIHWLNNAKGISRTSPRTESQARTRYNSLCQSGKRDVRLSDPNVIRTIAKLKKSMKRPNSGASTSSAAVMSSNVINPSSSANILETTTSSQLHTSTSSSHVNSSDNNAAPSNNPEA